eukprot:gene6653-3315_t
MKQALQREEEEAELMMENQVVARVAAVPMFETFWQGRLIPGSGALFFGPTFRVTRNKLTFRDSLPQLLATSVASGKNIEKRLREWLVDCHRQLDRIVRFEGMGDAAFKAMARKELGEYHTAFERVWDGSRALKVGDVVRLATKPQVVGRIRFFSVPQLVHSEGTYSQGLVCVTALPTTVHGDGNSASFPLRRVEEVLGEEEEAEHNAKEMMKLPHMLKIEPMKLGTGHTLELRVGDAVPEVSVSVMSANNVKMRHLHFAGQKVAIRVVQKLCYVGPGKCNSSEAGTSSPPVHLDHSHTEPPPASEGGAKKRGAKGRNPKPSKRKRNPRGAGHTKEGQANVGTAADEGVDLTEATANTAATGTAKATGTPVASLLCLHNDKENTDSNVMEGMQGKDATLLSMLNDKENKDYNAMEGMEGKGRAAEAGSEQFNFDRIPGLMDKSGSYMMYFIMQPSLPAAPSVHLSVCMYAAPGAPCRFELLGEGRALAATKELHLGEGLPPIRLELFDELGNELAPAAATSAREGGATPSFRINDLRLEVVNNNPDSTTADVVVELECSFQLAPLSNGSLSIVKLTFMGPSHLSIISGRRPGQSLQHTPDGALGEAPPHAVPDSPNQVQGTGMHLYKHSQLLDSLHSQLHSQAPQREEGQLSMIVRAVDLYLVAHLCGMPFQSFPVRIRPGPPALLRLLPGHPFSDAAPQEEGAPHRDRTPSGGPREGRSLSQLHPVEVMNGEALPDFKLQPVEVVNGEPVPDLKLQPVEVVNGEPVPDLKVLALDVWGNVTSPTSDISFQVVLDSTVCVFGQGPPDPAHQREPLAFDVDSHGVAHDT